jgi:chromosomal replication initiator protein
LNTTEITVAWPQALELLSNIKETRSPLAKTYLDYLVPVSLDDHQIVFAVRLVQAKNWIEERYLPYIKETVSTVLGSSREVFLVVDGALPVPGTATPAAPPAPEQAPAAASPSMHVAPPLTAQPAAAYQPLSVLPDQPISQPPLAQVPATTLAETPPVAHLYPEGSGATSALSSVFAPDSQVQVAPGTEPHSRFNFSNYVMGDSNEFAYKASLRVAEAPGLYFNPLFIYGRSGLGKTHLLLSIKNYINTYLLDKRVVYAPITEFVNDFTNAMAGDRDLTSFKRKYHTCDVLLIDDVQNLEGKEGTTDALFEIFNIFIESRKQIVLSADRSPVDINIDERFTSRFAQGITADIQPPNYEMKAAILKKYKSYYCNFLSIPEVEFSDEAIQKIVELSGSNIRELEGAVSNLIVYVSYRPDKETLAPITYSDVESVLGSSFFHKPTRRVDFDMVIKAVETYFNISRAELISEKRSKNISHPRQIAMYLIRRYTDMSYPEIGDGFNKDHSTVIYADKNIQSKMVEEVGVKVEVERIAEILTA